MAKTNEFKAVSNMIARLEYENDVDLENIKTAESFVESRNKRMGERHAVIDILSQELNKIARKNLKDIERASRNAEYHNCFDCKVPMPLSNTPQRCKGCSDIIKQIDEEMGEQ